MSAPRESALASIAAAPAAIMKRRREKMVRVDGFRMGSPVCAGGDALSRALRLRGDFAKPVQRHAHRCRIDRVRASEIFNPHVPEAGALEIIVHAPVLRRGGDFILLAR